MMQVMVAMPVLIRSRAVMYRERASRLYAPEVHAAAFALVELPWVGFTCLAVVPILYFMVGLVPTASAFFFFVFVTFTFAYMLLSLGHAIAALVPDAETAISLLSGIIPVFFLFGGLLIAASDIPVWFTWMYRLDPLSYAITAVAAPQFQPRRPCSGPYPDGDCPTVTVLSAAGVARVDRVAYVEQHYGIYYADRWRCVGFIACFAAFNQVVHFLATRFLTHMRR